MENQEKTQQEIFADNLKNLLDSAPEGVDYFLVAKVDKGENHAMYRGISACRAKGLSLSKMLANAISEVPSLKIGFEMALTISKIESNPIEALKDLFENLGTRSESRS
ncbi:hypothetical protein HZP71_02370 [Elizabethkingia anophelis]|nr:hypothetical protein [Elizabethkingia anophelis]MCT3679060.1 hypothetical protein [Elizabethkingia anophelis]MCT4121488.1 hypothetical protein [Elizabethkingia anophelis]